MSLFDTGGLGFNFGVHFSFILIYGTFQVTNGYHSAKQNCTMFM